MLLLKKNEEFQGLFLWVQGHCRSFLLSLLGPCGGTLSASVFTFKAHENKRLQTQLTTELPSEPLRTSMNRIQMYTVDREMFVVKKISWLPQTTKNISQPIIASCL